MVRLDSIRILTGFNSVKEIKKDYFFMQNLIDIQSNETVRNQMIIKPEYKTFGLKNIQINSNDITIELSAKILGKYYFELINKNNIEQVIDNINNQAIEFDKSKIINGSKILRCDITSNLRVKKDIDFYIGNLSCYIANEKYIVSCYKRKSGSSVVFDRDVKSYKQRMTFYDKGKEILRDKELVRCLGTKISDFSNILRCEQNITSFERIRKTLGISTNNLSDILMSNKNPNLDVFNDIIKDPIYLFNYPDDMAFNEIVKREGIKQIIRVFRFDKKKIRNFIRERYKGRPSYWYSEFDEVYNEMLKERDDQNEAISEIKELLKVS